MIEPTASIRALTPYRPAASATMTATEKTDYLCLDFNEATWRPAPQVAAALRVATSGALNAYPDMTAADLRAALAGGYAGVPADMIRVYAGSDAALRDICLTLLGPLREAVMPVPTYTQFAALARMSGGQVIEVAGETPFSPAGRQIGAALDKTGAQLVYVVNPCNPTGVLYGIGDIEGWLLDYPDTLFVVDEAYYEYAGTTVAPLVLRHANLIVVRSFSKAFALAGVRIGYVLAHLRLVEHLDRVRNGKEVSALAQVAATAALGDLAYMSAHVAEVAAARRWTVAQLRELGLEATPTPANFILIRIGDTATFVAALRERGVLVRDLDDLHGMAGYVRVTVGLQADMKRFVRAVEEVVRAGAVV